MWICKARPASVEDYATVIGFLPLVLATVVSGPAHQSANLFAQHITISWSGCVDCAPSGPNIRIQNLGSDDRAPVEAIPSDVHDGQLRIATAPGYIRVVLFSATCQGETRVAVLAARDRNVRVPMTCGSSTSIPPEALGLAGTIPDSVIAATLSSARSNAETKRGFLEHGAYFFDAVQCTRCELVFTLRDGTRSRFELALNDSDDSMFTELDVNDAALRAHRIKA